jgi:c-di-GMP-binding flagellar brake protein YcgR
MKAHLLRDGTTLQGRILDISSTGCFLKTREVIQVGTPVQIGFEAFQSRFQLEADVVWCAQMAVVHPQGLGLRFRNVPSQERKRLKKLEKKLKRMHAFYRRFRVLLSHQEFQVGWDAFLKQPLEPEIKKP